VPVQAEMIKNGVLHGKRMYTRRLNLGVGAKKLPEDPLKNCHFGAKHQRESLQHRARIGRGEGFPGLAEGLSIGERFVGPDLNVAAWIGACPAKCRAPPVAPFGAVPWKGAPQSPKRKQINQGTTTASMMVNGAP